MAEVKWIKIVTDVFDNRKIRQIETLPDGDSILVIWFKLLCLAGNINDGGLIYFTKELPYTDEMLATHFNRPRSTVILALETFKKFQMIDIVDNLLYISSWEKYQNIEGLDKIREQTRKRVATHREKTKKMISNVTVTQCNATEEEREEDKDKEKNKNTTTSVCSHLEKCNFILSPMLIQKIFADIELYTEAEVLKAIEIADSNGKRSYSYVKGILERRRTGESQKSEEEEKKQKAWEEFLND